MILSMKFRFASERHVFTAARQIAFHKSSAQCAPNVRNVPPLKHAGFGGWFLENTHNRLSLSFHAIMDSTAMKFLAEQLYSL